MVLLASLGSNTKLVGAIIYEKLEFQVLKSEREKISN